MKSINVKSAAISAIIVWVLGIIAFVASYFYPVIPDSDLQANWVLSIMLFPAVLLGAHIYYRKGHQTNGFVLGLCMFLMTIVLDAIITVPFFIMPYGGNYSSFFLSLSFWLIAVEYISVVAAYWQIEKAIKKTQVSKA